MNLNLSTYRTAACRRVRRAFTLLEMMVVVGIIALIVGAGIVAVGGAFGDAQVTRAEADVSSFKTALQMYRMKHGNYPKSNQGLQVLVSEGYLEQLPADPWGNPYQYEFPGKKNVRSFDVYSQGSNPEDKNDDIGNWVSKPES